MIDDTMAMAMAKTLLHSLWQGAIILLLLLLFNYFMHKKANLKYWSSVAALYLLFIINLATFYTLSIAPTISTELSNTANYSFIMQLISDNSAAMIKGSDSLFFKLVIIWWLGMAALLIYRLAGVLYLRDINLKARDLPLTKEINCLLYEKMAQLGMHNKVKIKTSHKIQSPFTFGIWKPVIMMPVAMLEWMNTDQLEIIILHELIHIRRNDFLINLINTVIEIIYFFNPAVWILRKIIEQEREYSCDYRVNVLLKNPIRYSNTLFELSSNNVTTVISLIQKKNLLMKRIQQIFGQRRPEVPVWTVMLIILLVVVSLSSYKGLASSENFNFKEQLNLNNFVSADNNVELIILPKKPKPSIRRPFKNFESIKSIKPNLKLASDDTTKSIDLKIKVDEGFTISGENEKNYYINGKQASKSELNSLDPESIKSIAVENDFIIIITKDYKGKPIINKKPPFDNQISIRSKLDKENKPLFILDGEIVSNESIGTLVAPDDIKSIKVLRDDKAIEVYGEEGKNGVIIIKSKK